MSSYSPRRLGSVGGNETNVSADLQTANSLLLAIRAWEMSPAQLLTALQVLIGEGVSSWDEMAAYASRYYPYEPQYEPAKSWATALVTGGIGLSAGLAGMSMQAVRPKVFDQMPAAAQRRHTREQAMRLIAPAGIGALIGAVIARPRQLPPTRQQKVARVLTHALALADTE